MLSEIKATIKKVMPFQSKPSYKAMYENEKRMREELESIHRTFCRQMDNVLEASKKSYSLYKVNDHNKEF